MSWSQADASAIATGRFSWCRLFIAGCLCLSLARCGAAPEPEARLDYASSPCAQCVSDKCKDELQRCDANTSCSGALLCLGRCQRIAGGNAEPACASACAAGVESVGRESWDAVERCRGDGAGTTCTACGTTASLFKKALFSQTCAPSLLADSCDRCMAEHCCDSEAACRNLSACSDLRTCIKSGCPQDPNDANFSACISACWKKYSDGRSLFMARGLCRDLHCPRECGGALPLSPAEVACLTCEATLCPDQLIEINTSEVYLSSLYCTPGCAKNDMLCLQHCLELAQMSLPFLERLTLCDKVRCAGIC